jgi:hypothetical protein
MYRIVIVLLPVLVLVLLRLPASDIDRTRR